MLFSEQLASLILWPPVIIASLIVMVGWIMVAYFITRHVNRRVVEITDHVYEEVGDIRYLIYGVSVLFWPAALGFGIYYLSNGRDAHVGRVCIFILLGVFTICFLAAIAILIFGITYFPEIADFFNR
jgi:hypothetical protein